MPCCLGKGIISVKQNPWEHDWMDYHAGQLDSSNEKPRDKSLIIILVVFAIYIAICLCGIAILLLYFSNFKPEPIPVPTSTSMPICPRVPNGWESLASDTFDTNKYGWPEDSYSDDYALVDSSYENGKYILDIEPLQGFYHYKTPDLGEIGDFYLTLDAGKASGTDDSYYGVIFRRTRDKFYYFAISDTQEYVFWVYITHWQRLLEWTDSTAIKPHEMNRITIFAEGSHFSFCVNDQWLDSVEDTQKVTGEIGFAVGAESSSGKMIFQLDNLNLYVPPK
jgi:hypothetical protein